MRALRSLNIAGVGLSLASITCLTLGSIAGGDDSIGLAAFVVGLPTLAVGVFWARLLRWRRTVGKSQLRMGWLLSIPLAALNAALAAGVLMSTEARGDRVLGFLVGMLAGATYGVFVWFPALLLTLLLFGVPIWWSQRQAERGLSGEERGEGLVGLAVSVLSLGSLAVTAGLTWHLLFASGVTHPTQKWDWLAPWGVGLTWAYAAGGLAAGLLACVQAALRERQRRQIVLQAAAGKIAGLRVDETAEGRVLVRVAPQGDSYRVSDLEEELVALDAEGNTLRALPVAPVEPRSLTGNGSGPEAEAEPVTEAEPAVESACDGSRWVDRGRLRRIWVCRAGGRARPVGHSLVRWDLFNVGVRLVSCLRWPWVGRGARARRRATHRLLRWRGRRKFPQDCRTFAPSSRTARCAAGATTLVGSWGVNPECSRAHRPKSPGSLACRPSPPTAFRPARLSRVARCAAGGGWATTRP